MASLWVSGRLAGGAADGAAEAPIEEADVEEVSDAEAEAIPEAELLSEFDKLEKSAEG